MSRAPYLDAGRAIEERVDDLLSLMTVEEKAGQLFQTMAVFRDGEALTAPADFIGTPSLAEMILDRQMTDFNVLSVGTGAAMAAWHNQLQDLSLQTRLKIPITLSSDPRHGFGSNLGTGLATEAFSTWPEALGLAAIGDEDLVEAFADTCRQEYLAIGVRVALHPQLDVATEPRWSRTWGTFGDDAELVSRLGAAYIRGLRGDHLGPDSVAAMIKHFPGNGPVENGEDPHFAHGQRQLYPGGNFDAHLAPFRAALAAGATQVMPSYGVPIGVGVEEVGCGFNHDIVTGLLRNELDFDGIVCTDWGLITGGSFFGEPLAARAWGVQHLSPSERLAYALAAGVDQFGGEQCPELVVELVDNGTVTETRLDTSIRRLLREKFALGLFERRHVDVDAAAEIVGADQFRAAGHAAQSRSVTVLTNPTGALPLREGCRLHVIGLDPQLAADYATVVERQSDADITIMRIAAPYEPRPGAFESMFHSGSLDFSHEQLTEILATARTGPTIIDVFVERPAILTPLANDAAAIVANYGCSDRALLDALFARVTPTARLPIGLPQSMDAVHSSPTDQPLDSTDTLFARGTRIDLAIPNEDVE